MLLVAGIYKTKRMKIVWHFKWKNRKKVSPH